ncbi:hypothetical protein DVP09_01940 [Yersinia enterocolitica]|nr:hypothetical protein [Yersinia enterocolitica]EKN5051826.1 hypothetical protein [Yersinia enterocolitica]EKN5110127.1 hypothetical protein [Yersinia enterocolitica]EKN5150673.1 hypothetical protein [Yersinia enterocolitica]EKN5946101.1 hypothetical protein [Yersinia enterocolitica]
MHIWVNTFLSVFSRCLLFLSVPQMVVLEVKAGMAEMVGIWAKLVNLVLTAGTVRMEVVQIIHRVAQDVREERIPMGKAIFISQEQKNNAIQARKTQ